MTLRKKPIENSGKRRKCWLPAFSPFPTMFSNPIKDKFRHLSHIQIVICKSFAANAENNLEFHENGGKLSKRVEIWWEKGKLLVMSNFSFSHSVFKRPILQTYQNKGLFGRGLMLFGNDLNPFSQSMAQDSLETEKKKITHRKLKFTKN